MKELFLSSRAKWTGLAASLLFFLFIFFVSIQSGQYSTSGLNLLQVISDFDVHSAEHVIIYNRLSRAVAAAIIGSSLAVAGALLQALTKNPMASPGIFGINAGALFFVVIAVSVFSISSLSILMWIAFVGAGIAAVIVMVLGGAAGGGLSPIRIVLAGTAVTAMFVSFTQGMLVVDEANLDQMLQWIAGTVANRTLDGMLPILPILLTAMIGAILMAHPINIMSSGDDIAKGLGQNILLVKCMIVILAVLMAGGAVAIGGMIGFIGLIVPHIGKALVGHNHYWLIPYCMLIGAGLLISADLFSRLVIQPQELPIGITTALLGAPFFIYLARKGFKEE